MFDGTTLIVDVVTLGENSYALSLPAEDLWVAYEVVRRHVDANGVRHYSQMTEAKTTSDGYSFKFDTGDTFTCSSHLDRPTSSTLSDTSSELPSVGASDKNKFLHANESTGALEWAEGGSGGGVLVVNGTWSDNVCTLDKTWQEIHDGGFGVVKFVDYDGVTYLPILAVYSNFGSYNVSAMTEGESSLTTLIFQVSSESGYPTYTAE